MDKAVNNIEAMFNKADADLNFLTRKLEFQVENDIDVQHNPIKLLKKVEQVKSEFTEITKDVAAIQLAQKEAVDFFRSQLLTLTQALGNLETETRCKPELPEETASQIAELSEQLGLSLDQLTPAPAVPQTVAGTSSSEITANPHTTASASQSRSKEDHTKSSEEDSNPVLTPFDLRAGSKSFTPLSKDEFMSVSDLVRGRAKLEDVNRTFNTIWDYFKKEGNTEALTPKEMNSKGMRVTGATGLAKLKILRALKLCSISKDGSVKLLL